MKPGMIALIAVSAAASASGTAFAQCATVDPVIVPQVRVDPLDAGGPAELVQPFVLTFRRAGVDTTPIVLRYQIVDEDSSAQSRIGRSQGPTVEWQSQDSSRDIGAFRSEGYALLRSGQALLGEKDQATQRTLSLRLTNLRDDLAAGVYREQFTIRYWCGAQDNTLPYEAQGIVAVSVAVPNVLSASIAGASPRGEIDFLDFAALTRSLQINVRSTGPYQVSARSLGGGALVREGSAGSTDSADRIAYRATLDNEPLNPGEAARPQRRAGLVGRRMTLDVAVEDIGDKRAGAYADTLLVTLAPVN
ncbi:MAG: hypothetical protein EON95_08345 [Caulobacteraceae bacterium]|nr:hypothetical protein [Caulobacter sp.]RYF93611.1 MAG: hypothetical protein EON95_08345 [Caulobacteraceae bacterium]